MTSYKTGDKVKVVGNGTPRHFLAIGSTATIRKVHESLLYLNGVNGKGENIYQSVDINCVELITEYKTEYKVRDIVRVLRIDPNSKAGRHDVPIGYVGVIVNNGGNKEFTSYRIEGPHGRPYVVATEIELVKSNNMKLEISKERVLEAASKCSTANATLRTLFPEAFEEDGKKEFYEKVTTFLKETVRMRGGGNLANRGIFLGSGSQYKFKIETDSCGYQVLTAEKV